MEITNSLDQQLEGIDRLPTGFFPSSSVIRNQHHHDKKRLIVIAYDHSTFGDAMIAKSIHLGLIKPTDVIRILNVVSHAEYRNMFAPMLTDINKAKLGLHETPTLDTHLASAADNMINEIINCLKKNGFVNVSSDIMRGDPKTCIVDYCRLKKPAYLIAGTRGLGSVKKVVMGSVSTHLIRHCPCPVLVCKLENSEIEERKGLNDQKQTAIADFLAKYSNKEQPQ